MSAPSVTAVVTAYNEEEAVADAVAATDAALKKYTDDYEIIVVNDASRDNTAAVIDAVAKQNPRVRPVHNKTNMNIGYNMRLAVSMSSKEYSFLFINGDNYPNEKCFQDLLSVIGKKDMVLGALDNYGDRHWTRRFLSWFFVKFMNLLFWNDILYYNGPIIVKTAVWRTVPMTTNGFAYMAEVVATLLKRSLTYTEVPYLLSPERKGMNVRVLKKNIFSVLRTVLSLFWRLNVQKKLYV